MNIIVSILGDQSSHDLSFITQDHHKNYLRTLNQGQKKLNLAADFPHVDKELIAIVQNMLEVNPYFRCSP